MDFTQISNGFESRDERGKVLAEIHYVKQGNTLLATHTYVDDSLRGQGIARALVDKLADFARANGKKIKPLCPYVVDLFERVDDYDDVKA